MLRTSNQQVKSIRPHGIGAATMCEDRQEQESQEGGLGLADKDGKPQMIVPDFWKAKGRYPRKPISPEMPAAKKKDIWRPRDMRGRGKK